MRNYLVVMIIPSIRSISRISGGKNSLALPGQFYKVSRSGVRLRRNYP